MKLRDIPQKIRNQINYRFALDRPVKDAFLADVSGVIHVGANSGQERMEYASRGLRVLWIEAIPDVFEELRRNVRFYPRQRARQYLLTDRDGDSYDFNVASNAGASSSILDFKDHDSIWPDIEMVRSIKLTSTSFATMIAREKISIESYNGLVLDVQGAEMHVLRGAEAMLHRFRYIKAETTDFELYEGCPKIDEMVAYLAGFGFRVFHQHKFAERADGGSCYDVVFRNDAL